MSEYEYYPQPQKEKGPIAKYVNWGIRFAVIVGAVSVGVAAINLAEEKLVAEFAASKIPITGV